MSRNYRKIVSKKIKEKFKVYFKQFRVEAIWVKTSDTDF